MDNISSAFLTSEVMGCVLSYGPWEKMKCPREPSSVSVLSSSEVVPSEAKVVLAWNTKGTCLD